VNVKTPYYLKSIEYYKGGSKYGRKEAVPRADDLLNIAERKNKNILKQNMYKVIFKDNKVA